VSLAIFVSACSGTSSGSRAAQAPPTAPTAIPSGWSTFDARGLGFTVSYPQKWHALRRLEPNSMSHTTVGFLTYQTRAVLNTMLKHQCPMTRLLGPHGLLIRLGGFTGVPPGEHTLLPSGPPTVVIAGHNAWIRTFRSTACSNQLSLDATVEVTPTKTIDLSGVARSPSEVQTFRTVVDTVRS
jgi:hypothetical protein